MIILLGANVQPLNATVSPLLVYGSQTGFGTCTSALASVSVTGGVPGYTYLWTRVSGDVLTITASTSATTQFSLSLETNQQAQSVYRCTVTDANGNTTTADVDVFLQEISFG